jgi:hypothetical protein
MRSAAAATGDGSFQGLRSANAVIRGAGIGFHAGLGRNPA